MWLFIYILWVVCAMFVWNHKLAPGKPKEWLLLVIGSIVTAVLWFVLARFASKLVFIKDESELSRLFDLGVALMIAPGLASIALAGWIRCLLLNPKP
jgi:hypothetical protein